MPLGTTSRSFATIRCHQAAEVAVRRLASVPELLRAISLSGPFIAAGEAHAFPVGTIDTFGTYVAPADFNETVNTLGQPLYAKQDSRKFERGTDLHTQSNPLPMCHRPGVLVKLTMS